MNFVDINDKPNEKINSKEKKGYIKKAYNYMFTKKKENHEALWPCYVDKV